MNPLTIAKSVTSLLVSTGAGAIVGNAIKATTPENLSTFNKVTILAGSFAISGIVGGASSKYVNKQIDDVVTQVKAIRQTATQ